MRIAFYSPMKPADHPTPSGDRQIARLFIKALQSQGHEVIFPSKFSSYCSKPELITGKIAEAEYIAKEALELCQQQSPDLWFTYHCYHKAPDLIGDLISKQLDIPYVLAEASSTEKHANGPWKNGYTLARRNIQAAQQIIELNPDDRAGIRALTQAPILSLDPFLDEEPFVRLIPQKQDLRQILAQRHNIDPNLPWMITVAMMRSGSKLQSYQMLAEALKDTPPTAYQHLIIGDGPEANTVKEILPNAVFVGQLPPENIAPYTIASDLHVWPAIGESIGLCILEAMASQIPTIMTNDRSSFAQTTDSPGIAMTAKNPKPYQKMIQHYLADQPKRVAVGTDGLMALQKKHTLETAGAKLSSIFIDLNKT